MGQAAHLRQHGIGGILGNAQFQEPRRACDVAQRLLHLRPDAVNVAAAGVDFERAAEALLRHVSVLAVLPLHDTPGRPQAVLVVACRPMQPQVKERGPKDTFANLQTKGLALGLPAMLLLRCMQSPCA